MKKMRLKKLKLLATAWWAIVFGCVGLSAIPVGAAGLSFTPAFIRVDIPAGENIQYAAVAIKNSTLAAAKLKATPTDVNTNDSALSPLTTSNSIATKSVSIASPSFTLLPDQDMNLIVKIDGTLLPAGGHYTSISIKQVVDATNKSIPITQAVSIGLFLVKEEGAQRLLNLTTKLPDGINFKMPKDLSLRFHAGGNIALVPRAAVSVMEGEEVLAKATINDNSKQLLPNESTNFDVKFLYQKALSPGKHKVLITYRYDGQTVPLTKEATFWYVPIWYVFIFLLGIAALIKFGIHYLRPHNMATESVPTMPVEVTEAPVTVQEIEALSMPLPMPETDTLLEVEPEPETAPIKSTQTKQKTSKKSVSKNATSKSKKQTKKPVKKLTKKSK